MAEAFLREIRLMSFNHAPKGWRHCGGEPVPIKHDSMQPQLALSFCTALTGAFPARPWAGRMKP